MGLQLRSMIVLNSRRKRLQAWENHPVISMAQGR